MIVLSLERFLKKGFSKGKKFATFKKAYFWAELSEFKNLPPPEAPSQLDE
jgi:hypothetical protein